MLPLRIKLRDFAASPSLTLDTSEQAHHVIRAIEPHTRSWVELDFSDIAGVSRLFAQSLLQRLGQELPDLWLVPKHCEPGTQELVAALVLRLERLREKAWIDGCERNSTGRA